MKGRAVAGRPMRGMHRGVRRGGSMERQVETVVRRRDYALVGFLTGLMAGAVAWSTAQHAYRRDLFSRHPLRRFAALGHLAGRPSVATAHLLREYVAWERRPTLRARGVRLLRDVEQALA